jgi:cell division protein FtsB
VIPVEIVVSFVIGYLLVRGLYAHAKLSASRKQVIELEEKNTELAADNAVLATKILELERNLAPAQRPRKTKVEPS